MSWQPTDRPIYLDFQSTTPLDPRVLDKMLPFMQGHFGNPHATSHSGQQARRAVEEARGHIASMIGAEADEIIFTSGATEANNMLIRGSFEIGNQNGRRAVVATEIEHKSVLEVVARLGQQGGEIRKVGVDKSGFLDIDQFAGSLDKTVAVATVIAANNEIGVVQNLVDIGEMVRQSGALFHSDAAQAVGKMPINVRAANLDLMSMSAHKIYGPMGVGAAFISRTARRRVAPLLHGGGQEAGFRSGTLPLPLCVGFGEACQVAAASMQAEALQLTLHRNNFLDVLRTTGVDFQVNGDLQCRLPGNLNLSFPGVDSEALLMRVREQLSIASGSACTAESLEPSHVILALGYGEDRAEEAVRIGFGRTTRVDEVIDAAQMLAKAVAGLTRVGYRRVAKG
jgi:cysteine desulfurase